VHTQKDLNVLNTMSDIQSSLWQKQILEKKKHIRLG